MVRMGVRVRGLRGLGPVDKQRIAAEDIKSWGGWMGHMGSGWGSSRVGELHARVSGVAVSFLSPMSVQIFRSSDLQRPSHLGSGLAI